MRARLMHAAFLVAVLSIWSPAYAQTATPTLTPTPDVFTRWLVPTVVIAGVPQPAQSFEFAYDANAGDVAIAFLVVFLLVSLWAMFLIVVLVERKQSGGGSRTYASG